MMIYLARKSIVGPVTHCATPPPYFTINWSYIFLLHKIVQFSTMCVTKCKERGTVLGHVFRFVSETALKSCFVTSESLIALFVSEMSPSG